MGKQDIARAGRAGYQRAVDDMMAYDAIKHLSCTTVGEDGCELCAIARHTAANMMATLTTLGLAPNPDDVMIFHQRDGGPTE